jgi:hemoglobin
LGEYAIGTRTFGFALLQIKAHPSRPVKLAARTEPVTRPMKARPGREGSTMQQSTAESEAAIKACVRLFYERAQGDDLLGPVFDQGVKDWPRHLAIMDDFWSSVLLGTLRYDGTPFPPHLTLPLTQQHFDRWRDLWLAAARETLPAGLRDNAAANAEHMSHCWGRAMAAVVASP